MNRWRYLGKCPLCNLRKDTTFHIGNFCFPLCYRCLFIIIGMFLGLVFLPKETFNLKFYFVLIPIFILPCYIDGTLQYKFNIPSTNARRIITGFIAGLGLALFHHVILHYV